MMEAYTERINQQREQEAVREQELREQELAAQREQELLAQKQAAQEEEELSPNSVFRQLIEEICGTKVCEEQNQNMEDMMLELLEDCRQKELYCMHNDVEDLIESALNSKLLLINLNSQRLDKEKQEVKNIVEQAPKHRTRFTKCLKKFKVIHKESTIPLNNTPQISSVNAITHDLPTEEPEYSLSMGDKHLDTISETELDVENLVPTLSESEVTSDNESKCDLPVNDESSPIFTTFSNPLFDSNDDFTSSDDESLSNEDVPMENFKIYSNPLFDDEEIISLKIGPHYFNAKSNLIESLLNRDILIDSSPEFDYLLEEFSGELAHIDPIPPGIVNTDLEPEEEICLIENLLYENSSPEERNSEIADTIVESLSPPPIPVEDSDSLMEEIDLFLASDDSMPPGIENDNHNSEGDIHFREELLSNNSPPLPENESFSLNHFDDPSLPRPPPKPPDVEVCFNIKPDTGVVTNKVVGDISEHDVLMPNLLPTQPTLCPVFDPLLPFSSENEDKVFKHGILISPFLSHRDKITFDFSASPMMISGGNTPYLDVPFLHFYPP
ncbi:hypothetical protein Tco_0080171 [Tanacetum coccineum]